MPEVSEITQLCWEPLHALWFYSKGQIWGSLFTGCREPPLKTDPPPAAPSSPHSCPWRQTNLFGRMWPWQARSLLLERYRVFFDPWVSVLQLRAFLIGCSAVDFEHASYFEPEKSLMFKTCQECTLFLPFVFKADKHILVLNIIVYFLEDKEVRWGKEWGRGDVTIGPAVKPMRASCLLELWRFVVLKFGNCSCLNPFIFSVL